jgi:hypothetical protein
MVEHLPSKHETKRSNPVTQKNTERDIDIDKDIGRGERIH